MDQKRTSQSTDSAAAKKPRIESNVSFDNLPNELLEMILNWVPPYPDLVNSCSRVSTRWHSASLRIWDRKQRRNALLLPAFLAGYVHVSEPWGTVHLGKSQPAFAHDGFVYCFNAFGTNKRLPNAPRRFDLRSGAWETIPAIRVGNAYWFLHFVLYDNSLYYVQFLRVKGISLQRLDLTTFQIVEVWKSHERKYNDISLAVVGQYIVLLHSDRRKGKRCRILVPHLYDPATNSLLQPSCEDLTSLGPSATALRLRHFAVSPDALFVKILHHQTWLLHVDQSSYRWTEIKTEGHARFCFGYGNFMIGSDLIRLEVLNKVKVYAFDIPGMFKNGMLTCELVADGDSAISEALNEFRWTLGLHKLIYEFDGKAYVISKKENSNDMHVLQMSPVPIQPMM